MKKIIFTLAVVMVLLLSSCDRDSNVNETDAVLSTSSLFDYVPADTPYLMAATEGMPEDIVEQYLLQSKPMIDSFQDSLKLIIESIADVDESTGHESNSDTDSATTTDTNDENFNMLAFASSLLDQYANNLSLAGLRSIGIDPVAKSVVYGLGPFPVVRTGIADQNKLRATLDKAFAAGGKAPSEQELNGRKYWQISDAGMTFIASIGDDEASAGLVPTSMLDEGLMNILGQTKPGNAIDVYSEMDKFNRQYGYTNFFSGWLKSEQLLNLFLNDDSSAANSLRQLIEFDNTTVTDICKTEMASMAATVPLFHFGMNKLELNESVMSVAIDFDAATAAKLHQLSLPDALSPSYSGSPFSHGLALNLAKLREWLLATAKQRTENPYQCEELAGLNSIFATAYENLNRPLPPFLGNLFGYRISVNEIDLTQLYQGSSGLNGKILLSILTSNPEMLIGMGQMFVPDLAGKEINAGEAPVALKLDQLPTGELPTWAAMSDSALGIALGEEMDSKLQPFLEGGGSKNGEFLTFGMSGEFYDKQLNAIIDFMPDGSLSAADLEDFKASMEIYESIYFKASFTEKGLVFAQQAILK